MTRRVSKASSKSRSTKPKPAWLREPALEEAIIAAPLDPVPRMVYADWLQTNGDRRGEWMALHAAIEREPTNVPLRSAAVDFLGRHAALLLGAGSKLLPGAWIGWRGGFIDEIRVHAIEKQRGTVKSFAHLLAHPNARFTRCIGLGQIPELQEAIDAVAAAGLPILDAVVVADMQFGPLEVSDAGALAALPSVRRLALHRAVVNQPMPQLRELAIRLDRPSTPWVAGGGCPELEALTVDCAQEDSPAARLAPILAALPKLRRLRLLHVIDADDVAALLRGMRLDELDFSYATLTDAGAEQLVGGGMKLTALRTQISEAMARRLQTKLPSAVVSRGGGSIGDDEGVEGSWLHHVLATQGRDGLALVPGVGRALFSIGTRHSLDNRERVALPLLDACLTFPAYEIKTHAWANAAIAHERLLELEEAELIAREGLLRTPTEPNLFAIVIDALRRSNRLAQAEALLPRAIASITAPQGPGAHVGGPGACLADCMLVLAQAGRHDEVLELADEHATIVTDKPHIYAIVAMTQVALGNVAGARATIRKAKEERVPGLFAHARAVLELAGARPRLELAVASIEKVKEQRYPEWHWIARDPNLAKLADHPRFRALVD